VFGDQIYISDFSDVQFANMRDRLHTFLGKGHAIEDISRKEQASYTYRRKSILHFFSNFEYPGIWNDLSF
jgi:predicted GNAT superfamily acetyltransferase